MKRRPTLAERGEYAKEIIKLYGTTSLTMTHIATTVGCSWEYVKKTVVGNFSKAYRTERKAGCYRRSKEGVLNPMYGKYGARHHNFIGAVSDNKGYLMVLKPEWYTGRKRSKHIFEHHYVYCITHGLTCIPKGFCVHHKDQVKTNNNPDNLLLLPLGEHAKLHHRLRRAETIREE